MSQYRFNKEEHLHEVLKDNKWVGLTGTSTVLSVIAKPLTWWASGLAVSKLGWSNSKEVKKPERLEKANGALSMIKEMDTETYLSLLDDAYKAHSVKLKDSAQAGTDLHAELECFVKNHMEGKQGTYVDKIKPFIEWTEKNVEKFLWSEMHCYDTNLFIGGISDCGALLKNGEVAIIDFKSSKDAYASQAWQIAGYDLQITANGGYTKDGEKMFTLEKPITQHIVVPFGAEQPYPVVFRDVESNKNAFKASLTIYRELNKANNQ